MTAGKLTPRQRMIAMMYLVLTALLALNVSKDILEAFVIVNNSLERSHRNLSERTQMQYSDFDLAKSVDPVRITADWEKAQTTRKLSEELVTYIESVKKRLISEAEGVDKKTADTLKLASVEKKDEYDISTHILIGELEDGSRGIAREIKSKLNYFREQLAGFIAAGDRKKIDLGINTSDPPPNENNENWELSNFHNTPLAACITILSKMQNDAKNAETILLDYLLKKHTLDILPFDTIAPRVIPQTNYVLLGEEYKADVFIAAYNKTLDPAITAGIMDASHRYLSDPAKLNVEKGIGKYTFKTSREGIVQWGGSIRMVTPKGKTITYPFTSEFIVARPSLTVSADKMNVFYMGVENPVSISVPGVPNERVKVSISTGAIARTGDGKYLVTGVSGRQALISVSATMGNGEVRQMGISEYRVKPLPTPYAKCGELTASGKMSRAKFKVLQGILAEYDKTFEFGARPEIISFDMEIIINNYIQGPYKSTKNKFPPELGNFSNQLHKVNKIFLTNIKAMGPDKILRTLPEMMIVLN